MQFLRSDFRLSNFVGRLLLCLPCFHSGLLNAEETPAGSESLLVQPIHDYELSFEPRTETIDGQTRDLNPLRFYTALSTDYGVLGSPTAEIVWSLGSVKVKVREGQPAGMWHSVAGLMRESDHTRNMAAVFPSWINAKYQPRCWGLAVRASGQGMLTLALNSASGECLWKKELHLEDRTQDYLIPCPANKLTAVKSLNWTIAAGGSARVDAVWLLLKRPALEPIQWAALASYAKLSRCFDVKTGLVKDRAHWPAGEFDNVPTTGMFVLASAAASKQGFVSRQFAVDLLHTVHRQIARLETVHGVLPHFVRRIDNEYRICPGTEFSTIDTAIYYHSMLLAAEILNVSKLVQELHAATRRIDFEKLYDDDGFVTHGFADGTRKRLPNSWRDWGGETALVLLLAHLAQGDQARLRMNSDGKVYQGVGFIAEIQSLFFPQFSRDEPDRLTHVDWRRARRDLLEEQQKYFPQFFPDSAVAKLGLYGLSAGEGPRGIGYVANGTDSPQSVSLLHPHYLLMSATLLDDLTDIQELLEVMQDRGLFPPWGMVENFSCELDERVPLCGSLNASFETLAALHLLARFNRTDDPIYQAAESCPPLVESMNTFYLTK